MQDQLKEVMLQVYTLTCAIEKMFDYLPLAELKVATKVFYINPWNSYQSHPFCLFLLLPADAVR